VRLLAYLRTAARANRLANHRLHASMAALPDSAFAAPRAGFFPSLSGTLNHVLAVDVFYVAALLKEADMRAQFTRFVACRSVAELARRQRTSDERLIGFLDGFDDDSLDVDVVMDRGSSTRIDRAAHVLAHLFMHQTHHRGQAHAMLSSTAIEPPQLDDFLLPSDAPARVADMATLGWTERELFGT
jgi:uncharacterized damage-inducible protein DinB